MAMTRKNYLFAGSDSGGARAAGVARRTLMVFWYSALQQSAHGAAAFGKKLWIKSGGP